MKKENHIIDCDADPFVPGGWKVEKHQKGGPFKWDPKQVQFYLSKSQKKGSYIVGNELRTELEGKPVLNANVLDYLLAHPHLIPKEWKQDGEGYTRYIFFWGTIYRHSDGDLYVRYLYWSGGGWYWSYDWLGSDWHGGGPAALRASIGTFNLETSDNSGLESRILENESMKNELIYFCVRCHRKFEELGEVLKWGKYYPACQVKLIDGTIELRPDTTEIVEALCKDCMVEVNKKKNDANYQRRGKEEKFMK